MRIAFAFFAVFILAGTGCAKNVDRIEFTKWGHSFLGQRGVQMDTTAQGGAANNNGTIPQSTAPITGSVINKMPKASVGGTYHRTFATSPSYRMLGGFHTPGQ